MIARIWHGRVPVEKTEAYSQYLRETGLKDYEATQGNRGVYLLKKPEGVFTHFITLTFWRDIASIKKFSGPEFEKARYYQKDPDFLTEQETYVAHYEIVEPLNKPTGETGKDTSFQDIFFERPILFYR